MIDATANSANVGTWHEPGTNKFRVGNPGGPGNPQVRRVAAIRAALAAAFTPEEVVALLRKLYDLGMDGDTVAAREVLDRVAGKAEAQDLLDRMAEVQRLFEQLIADANANGATRG